MSEKLTGRVYYEWCMCRTVIFGKSSRSTNRASRSSTVFEFVSFQVASTCLGTILFTPKYFVLLDVFVGTRLDCQHTRNKTHVWVTTETRQLIARLGMSSTWGGAVQVLLFAELCRAAGWPYPKAHTWMQVFEDSRKLAHIPNGVHCAGQQLGFKSCYTTHSFHIHLQQVTTLLSQMRRVHIV